MFTFISMLPDKDEVAKVRIQEIEKENGMIITLNIEAQGISFALHDDENRKNLKMLYEQLKHYCEVNANE